MPRQSRINYPGSLHHVMLRGIERKNIFRDDKDREEFLQKKGRNNAVSEGKSLLCYWCFKELGTKGSDLAHYLGISQPSVTEIIKRGESRFKNTSVKLINKDRPLLLLEFDIL